MEIVNSSAEPAFATDAEGRIVAWNRGAEGLLGYPQCRALGQACWSLLGGRDLFGNRYCGAPCPLMGMVRDHEAVHHCELVFKSVAGDPTPARVSLFAVSVEGASSPLVIHVLSAASSEVEHRGAAGFDGYAARSRVRLTPRELEVLSVLAEGKGTPRIGVELGVSVHTVRHHVERLFHKLHAHNRLEAVATARRLGLIP